MVLVMIKSQVNNPNWLQQMPRKQLKEYVFNLIKLVENETDKHNLSLYQKWLKEAQNELYRRDKIISYYANKKTTNK